MNNSVASSPFVPSSNSVARIMLLVILCMLPGIIAFNYFYGWGVIINLVIACASAWLFELFMLLLLQRPLKPYVFDFSALVTAMLLALALPPLVHWWLPVVGMFFAIVVAKHLYGGLGYNTFNPAMAAYCILLVSFPKDMSLWLSPMQLAPYQLGFMDSLNYVLSGQLPGNGELDAISSATVLDHMRIQVSMNKPLTESAVSPIFGFVAGKGMEWVNLLFLGGGLVLIYKRIISWHIPVAVLASLGFFAGLFHLIDPAVYYSPMIHLLAGASILGAFFVATDPVTAATTPRGKLIYGAGIGLLMFTIRAWGGYPDGLAFAVLLMGLSVPLLDQYTLPKVFGEKKRSDV